MIVFGSRTAHVVTRPVHNSVCSSCSNSGTISLSVFRNHFHVFWIPMFPYGKKGVSQCSHCKNVLTHKEMPERLKNEYHKIKQEHKGPVWQFSGLVLLVLLISFIAFQINTDNKNESLFIQSPANGDVYYQKLPNGSYSTGKVVNVTNDRIFLVFNKFEIAKMSRVYKIDKEENYASEAFSIHIKDLKKMYEDNEIYRIKRD